MELATLARRSEQKERGMDGGERLNARRYESPFLNHYCYGVFDVLRPAAGEGLLSSIFLDTGKWIVKTITIPPVPANMLEDICHGVLAFRPLSGSRDPALSILDARLADDPTASERAGRTP